MVKSLSPAFSAGSDGPAPVTTPTRHSRAETDEPPVQPPREVDDDRGEQRDRADQERRPTHEDGDQPGREQAREQQDQDVAEADRGAAEVDVVVRLDALGVLLGRHRYAFCTIRDTPPIGIPSATALTLNRCSPAKPVGGVATSSTSTSAFGARLTDCGFSCTSQPAGTEKSCWRCCATMRSIRALRRSLGGRSISRTPAARAARRCPP